MGMKNTLWLITNTALTVKGIAGFEIPPYQESFLCRQNQGEVGCNSQIKM